MIADDSRLTSAGPDAPGTSGTRLGLGVSVAGSNTTSVGRASGATVVSVVSAPAALLLVLSSLPLPLSLLAVVGGGAPTLFDMDTAGRVDVVDGGSEITNGRTGCGAVVVVVWIPVVSVVDGCVVEVDGEVVVVVAGRSLL